MTSTPPFSSICIMSDVPERGNPETIMISSKFICNVSPLDEAGRSNMDVQKPAKTQSGNHGYREPITQPRVGAARPRRALRIVNLDRPDRGVGAKRLLPRVEQSIRPA